MKQLFLVLCFVSFCYASHEQRSIVMQRSLQHPQVAGSEDELVKKLQQFMLVAYCTMDASHIDVRIDLDRENAPVRLPLPCFIYRRSGEMSENEIKTCLQEGRDIVTYEYSLCRYYLDEKWSNALLNLYIDDAFDHCT